MSGSDNIRAGRRASSGWTMSPTFTDETALPQDPEAETLAPEESGGAKTKGSSPANTTAWASVSPEKIMTKFREGKSKSTRALAEAKNLIVGGNNSLAAKLRREDSNKDRRAFLWAEFSRFTRSGAHPGMCGPYARACFLVNSPCLLDFFHFGSSKRWVPCRAVDPHDHHPPTYCRPQKLTQSAEQYPTRRQREVITAGAGEVVEEEGLRQQKK